MLTRTVFIESVGRYDRLFSINQPSHFAQFTERVPMVKGRLDRRASTATGYCWLVWDKESSCSTQLVWILLAAKLWSGRTTNHRHAGYERRNERSIRSVNMHKA